MTAAKRPARTVVLHGARAPRHRRRTHALSAILAGMVVLWIVLYARANPDTHLGAFYGNAIADWLGVLVFVVATKYLFEVGSGESRKPPRNLRSHIGRLLVDHSLTLALGVTAVGWMVLYARTDVSSPSGQVVGNIVSNWLQALGLVLLTKYARETGSKEGN